jgi:ABC-type nickel/cobalt efflux system permease component RcnA
MAALVVVGLVAGPAAPAQAHPAGRTFLVNLYAGLTFTPDEVRVAAVVNTAEVITRQDRQIVDSDKDGVTADAERSRYARTTCADLAAHFDVQVNGSPLDWTVVPGDYRYEHGSPGLPSARLTCDFAAPARLAAPSTVTIANRYRMDRTGWHELTAGGIGVHLVKSPLPQHSVTDELRTYPPSDALTLDVRTATVRIEPGPGEPNAPPPVTSDLAGASAPANDDGPLAAGVTWAEQKFQALAAGRVTPLSAALAVLAAVSLGAGHAALPGHGKTVMAAYLAGRRGSARDAVAIGGMVTVSHTGVVLMAGALISAGSQLAGDSLLRVLGATSGLLIVAVGLGMLVNVLRRRTAHDHDHHHGHDHDHAHTHGGRPVGRLGLAGIGLAGGLVPSPSAMVVLLASVSMGRAVFGILLVLAYGIGMAGTLTGAGLLLLAARRNLAAGRPARALARLGAMSPTAYRLLTPILVLCVGAGLIARAATAVA